MSKYKLTYKVAFFRTVTVTADDATDAQYLAEAKLKRQLGNYAEEMDTIYGDIEDWDIEIYDADERHPFMPDTMEQLEKLCDVITK